VKPLRILLPALVLLGIAVAGCAENKAESESPLKVAHAGGETIVPSHPTRVVALEPDAIETPLALGVPVTSAVSVKRDGTLGRHLGERRREIPVIGKAWDFDLFELVAAGPDVILGSKFRDGSLRPELDEIGPTVLTEDTGPSWKQNLRLHGEALNRPDAAEGLLRDYDRRVSGLARKLGPDRYGQDVSLLRATPAGIEVYARDSFPGTVLADAGLGRPPAQAVRGKAFVPLRKDEIADQDGDLLLLSVAEGGEDALRGLMADPAWSRLRAVREGHVRRVDDDAWITGQGILAARRMVDDLSRMPL
jgi:iron complex transport system substrate-binding protein